MPVSEIASYVPSVMQAPARRKRGASTMEASGGDSAEAAQTTSRRAARRRRAASSDEEYDTEDAYDPSFSSGRQLDERATWTGRRALRMQKQTPPPATLPPAADAPPAPASDTSACELA